MGLHKCFWTADASAATAAASCVCLDSISGGEATLRELCGCAVDLSPMRPAGLDVRGLLGLNFIREYRLTIEFADRSVRFDPLAVPPATR